MLKVFLFVVIVLLVAGFGVLQRNDAKLFDEPGPAQRLKIFFTTNQAETSESHIFRELRTPVFQSDSEKLYQRVINAATQLGWEVEAHDSENQSAHFIVYSPVFLFKDDVYVQVRFINMNESSLHIKSQSRKGNADLAANSGHIQRLIAKIQH